MDDWLWTSARLDVQVRNVYNLGLCVTRLAICVLSSWLLKRLGGHRSWMAVQVVFAACDVKHLLQLLYTRYLCVGFVWELQRCLSS